MSQHISQTDLDKYFNRALLPTELVAFDTHLAECDECFEKTAGLRAERSAAISLHDTQGADPFADGHLSYEQFAAYVDDDIGEIDREIVDVHKSVCSECAPHLDELLDLRAGLEIDAGPAVETSALTAMSPIARLWSGVTNGGFLKFAAPAFAVLLIGVIVWSVWLLNGRPPAEIVEVVDTTGDGPGIATNVATDNTSSVVEVQTNSSSAPSQSATSLADGGTRIGIDDTGNVTGLNAPQFESRIKAALTTQNIEISSAARDLRSRSGVLMGGGQTGVPFALTTPVGKVIESDRPQFRWRQLAGAETYVVTVFDANFNKVAESPPLKQAAWNGARLKRGGIYQWQVVAAKDSLEIKSPVRPAPDAKFKIVDSQHASDIDAAKRSHRNSHLLLGILYANAGLLDEAELEFRALLRQNPKSDVARRLLNKVKAAR